jgi:hypothetical protein
MLWATILTHISQQVVESFTAFPIRTSKTQTMTTTAARYGSSMSAKENDTMGQHDSLREWDQEETLLAMNLSPLPDKPVGQCLQHITDYTQSFPFAVVLPVQPLLYLPTGDGGVELKFLRKKTDVKSGIDGGIRFFVRQRERESTMDELPEAGEDEKLDMDEEPSKQDVVIEIIAKRNSKGQSISKLFAEKLVIQAFVKGIIMGAGDVEY